MQKNWVVLNHNKRHLLRAGNKIFECQLGDGGLKLSSKKIEGDKVTPIGLWRLKSVYYRADRIITVSALTGDGLKKTHFKTK